jgi:hypothetical protein
MLGYKGDSELTGLWMAEVSRLECDALDSNGRRGVLTSWSCDVGSLY